MKAVTLVAFFRARFPSSPSSPRDAGDPDLHTEIRGEAPRVTGCSAVARDRSRGAPQSYVQRRAGSTRRQMPSIKTRRSSPSSAGPPVLIARGVSRHAPGAQQRVMAFSPIKPRSGSDLCYGSIRVGPRLPFHGSPGSRREGRGRAEASVCAGEKGGTRQPCLQG